MGKRAKTLIAAMVIGFLTSALPGGADPVSAADEPGTALGGSVARLLQRSLRWPVLTVPLLDKAPTIDGVVDDAEWSSASLVSDLLYTSNENEFRAGLPTKYRSRYWIAYTTDAIYVAARFDMPAWAPQPVAQRTTHDNIGTDDVVDIFLMPDGKREFHLSGNSINVTMDRELTPESLYFRWEPKTEFRARVLENGGWEAEYKIPFAEMSRTTPKPGERWLGQFVSVRKVPEGSVAAWTYWGAWRGSDVRDPQRMGMLIFSGQPTGVQFRSGANTIGQKPIELALVGKPLAEPAKIEVRLFKRPGQFKPSDSSLVTALAEALDKKDVGGSDYYGQNFEQISTKFTQDLKPLDGVVQITADSARLQPTERGEYLMVYQITQGSSEATQILAAGALPFRVEEPVSLAVKPHLLNSGIYQADTDLSGIEKSHAKSVRVTVTPEGQSKPIAQATTDIDATMERVEIKAADWPPGHYRAKAEVLGSDGAVLGFASEKVDKQAVPSWWTKPEGFEPEVPEPWSPVQVSVKEQRAQVKVWNRTYTFDRLPIPATMSSAAQQLSDVDPRHPTVEMLASPMELNLTAGGKAAAWRCTKFEIIEQRPSQVVIATENTAGACVLKGKTTIEFDGMVRVDLELASIDGSPVPIDALDLVIAMKSEVAEFFSNYRKAAGAGTKLERYIGQVPKEKYVYPVYYTEFLGNGKMGLEWFCDSLRGWRVSKGDQSFELERKGDKVVETFHIVDHATKLETNKPVTATFGLIATPTKPMRRGWEHYRLDQGAGFVPLVGEKAGKGTALITQEDVDAWKRRMQFADVKVNSVFDTTWAGVASMITVPDPDSDFGKQLKKRIEGTRAMGQIVAPYGGWKMISTTIPEWPVWGHEMTKEPIESTIDRGFMICYNSPYTSFQIASYATNARLYGTGGVRTDTIAPMDECNSLYHGCGWHDENGKLHGSNNLFAAREFLKRMYRVFHGGVVNNGVQYFVTAGPPVMAFDSFSDYHEIGEGNFERAPTLKIGYSPADVRVRMVGSAYGFITMNNLKGLPLTPNERMAALLVAGGNPRMASAGKPASYYRGYQKTRIWGPNSVEIWDAYKWIDIGRSSLWVPYWENQDSLKIEPKKITTGETAELYGSYYVISGKRVLLIVTNYEQEPLSDVKVTLDLKKLGFAPDAKLHAEDAITQEVVDYSNGSVKLDLFAQRYRIVKISAETPRFAETKLGPNLLAENSFDKLTETCTVGAAPAGQKETPAAPDSQIKRSNAASLRLRKTVDATTAPCMVSLPIVNVEPGNKYLFTGYVKIDDDIKPPLEGTNPRLDYAFITIEVDGQAILTEPSREFSVLGGRFVIGEKTPGWARFTLPFEAGAKMNQAGITVKLTGVGTAWVSDLQLQKVTSP